MTRTAGVRFRGVRFWVYDVVGGIYLKHLVDAATEREDRSDWLNQAIEGWRVAACVTELASYANEEWDSNQVETVIDLCLEAIQAIERQEVFTSLEIEAWPVHEELRIRARGHEEIPSRPIVAFGHAFIALLEERLPRAPDLHWWFYTLADDPETTAMAVNDR